jgi:hypothetical protein
MCQISDADFVQELRGQKIDRLTICALPVSSPLDFVSNLGLRYLYGGASINEGPGFGDTYILSLPSFTWIKVKHHDSKILRGLDLLKP